ncbi:hypothetical protein C8C83_1672 [Flavobacterium sp. 90]|nr:hypothetical protein C8C82_1974 [Flavobacterium sp. 81]TCK53791.1 hypothetical protein C8C83_1672 [Flavobacterium sp. 90]
MDFFFLQLLQNPHLFHIRIRIFVKNKNICNYYTKYQLKSHTLDKKRLSNVFTAIVSQTY